MNVNVNKALSILKARKELDICIKAGICIQCGDSLQEPKKTIKSFFGFHYISDNQTSPDSPFYYLECLKCNKIYIRWF